MKTKKYPSDLTGDQFDRIRPLLESVRKKTRPRRLDMHDIFNAVLYSLRTGCQWRALPGDYPKWEAVYYYFRIWTENGEVTEKSILHECLKKIGWRGPFETGAQYANKLPDR